MSSDLLLWKVEDNLLSLTGELDRETLQSLWHQRHILMQQINTIDVSCLARVDSAGLALMVHLRQIVEERGQRLRFVGISEKLGSLITLYNLQDMITDHG
jgi:phospholipid transport system transporter-binding protein